MILVKHLNFFMNFFSEKTNAQRQNRCLANIAENSFCEKCLSATVKMTFAAFDSACVKTKQFRKSETVLFQTIYEFQT